MSPATRNAHLYVGEFEAPAVFPAEEHLDTGALARRLELLSAPFGQSDLQDLDCLGLGCQVPGRGPEGLAPTIITCYYTIQ